MNDVSYEQALHNLNEENIHLRRQIVSESDGHQKEISRLKLRIQELEDWNEDRSNERCAREILINDKIQEPVEKQEIDANLRAELESAIKRNRQLEVEIQRLLTQQRNNQLALERLDEYEETISQLQDQIDQLKSSKSKSSSIEIDLNTRIQNAEEISLKWKQEGDELRELLEERNNQLKEEKQLHLKETLQRETLEKQIVMLNQNLQNIESEKTYLHRQLEELDEKLKSKEIQIQNIQTTAMTPGAPPSTQLSSTLVNDSHSLPMSNHQMISSNEEDRNILQFYSIYDQFRTLLPDESFMIDDGQTTLPDRFIQLFEQLSTYIGTFAIIQEEFDSLKQILSERQDEIDRLQAHCEQTTNELVDFRDDENIESDIDDDVDNELKEILYFHQRAPSQQSLSSITPGEKQQLVAQNEILSTLLNEKEQELILLQQNEKIQQENLKTIEHLRTILQQMENSRDTKAIEFNDVKHILDEKLRENSSLKKEKMILIERITELEREKQEQASIIHVQSKSDLVHIDENLFNSNQFNGDTDKNNENSKHRLIDYNELNEKYQQLCIDFQSVESLLEQKSQAYLQCQNELNTFQNLYYHQKNRCDDNEYLRETLVERETQLGNLIRTEQELRVKQSDMQKNLEMLQEKTHLYHEIAQKLENKELELKRITHERDFAMVEKKQLEYLLQSQTQKLTMNEEQHTQVVNRCKELEDSLASVMTVKIDLEETNHVKQIHQDLETVKDQYQQIKEQNENLINQLEYQLNHSTKLQRLLDQYNQDRDKYVQEQLNEYQECLREKISLMAQLTNENNELQQRLNQIKGKDKQQQQDGSRVEKQLVKNILLSYFQTPIDKQLEVIPLLGALLDFTNDECQKAMSSLTNNHQMGGNSWFSSWLGTDGNKNKNQGEKSSQSFTELLIQYIDQQSKDSLDFSHEDQLDHVNHTQNIEKNCNLSSNERLVEQKQDVSLPITSMESSIQTSPTNGFSSSILLKDTIHI